MKINFWKFKLSIFQNNRKILSSSDNDIKINVESKMVFTPRMRKKSTTLLSRQNSKHRCSGSTLSLFTAFTATDNNTSCQTLDFSTVTRPPSSARPPSVTPCSRPVSDRLSLNFADMNRMYFRSLQSGKHGDHGDHGNHSNHGKQTRPLKTSGSPPLHSSSNCSCASPSLRASACSCANTCPPASLSRQNSVQRRLNNAAASFLSIITRPKSTTTNQSRARHTQPASPANQSQCDAAAIHHCHSPVFREIKMPPRNLSTSVSNVWGCGAATHNQHVDDAGQSQPAEQSRGGASVGGGGEHLQISLHASAKQRRHSLNHIGFGQLHTYEKRDFVGQGTYGVVFAGKSLLTDKRIAMKEIKFDSFEGAPCTAIREISLLRQLNHANIVTLHDVVYCKHNLTMIFEFVDQDLKQYMQKNGMRISAFHVRLFFLQMLLALNFCHANKIIHRDLKPQNILINEWDELKLADFGLARATSIPTKNFSHRVVSLWYRPPELLLGHCEYSNSVDMWAAGCILVEMLTGSPAFPGIGDELAQLSLIFDYIGHPARSAWQLLDSLLRTNLHRNSTEMSSYFRGLQASQNFRKGRRRKKAATETTRSSSPQQATFKFNLIKCEFTDADWLPLLSGLFDYNFRARLTAKQILFGGGSVYLSHTARDDAADNTDFFHSIISRDELRQLKPTESIVKKHVMNRRRS